MHDEESQHHEHMHHESSQHHEQASQQHEQASQQHEQTEYTLSMQDFIITRKGSPNGNYKQLSNQQIIVKLIPYYSNTYKYLTASIHRKYIAHGIPQIPNNAPTLMQFFQELKVYRNEVQDSALPIFNRDVKQEFFANVNSNFASSKNVRVNKYRTRKLVPLYYYFYDSNKNMPIKMSISLAKRLFCKMYEHEIMTDEKSRLTFLLLHAQCKVRNKEFPIVIITDDSIDSRSRGIDFEKFIAEDKYDFTCAYCLVEMLIHYPNLNECFWNKE